MAKYVKRMGLQPKIDFFAQFYAKEVSVDFPTRPLRPVPLTDTGGILQLRYANIKMVPFPGIGVSYAYNQQQNGIRTNNGGSDSGLMNNAIANLNSIMDLLTTLAELPQTIAMLLSAADAVIRAAHLFSKGRVVDGLKALGKFKDMSRRNQADARRANRLHKRTPEGTVLEFQMGWKPFIGDINSSLELLNASFEKGKKLKRSASNTFTTDAQRKSERSTMGYSKEGTLETFPRVTVSISAEIANSEAALLSSLGVNNPSGILWELTPYSFLVDYFVGVGDFLGALTGLAGLNNLRGTKATTSVTTLLSRTDIERGTIVNVTRTLIPVGWTFPGLKLAGLSTNQIVNVAALMKQRLPRN